MTKKMTIQTYQQAKEYIESYIGTNFPKTYGVGLNRIKHFLELLENPQNKYPTVHIGGTSGKTSTSTMLAAILQQAGYKTGLHISPHLEDMRERMQINGQLMPEAAFCKRVTNLMPVLEQMKQSQFGPPSYFEILLALTFQYFAEEKVAIAVIEVGLGGTLDGTNVINPLTAILTNVSLDHTEILGDTVEQIATDKVGIFKKGIEVISGVTQPSVRQIVIDKANAVGCHLQLLNQDFHYEVTQKNGQAMLIITYNSGKTTTVKVHDDRTYQAQNCALAVVAAKTLLKHGFAISDQVISQALSQLTVPGRLEVFERQTTDHQRLTIILDGAHNPAKMEALVSSLKKLYPGKKFLFVIGVKKDKKKEEMLALMEPIAKRFYFTQFLQTTDFGKAMAIEPTELESLVTVEHEVIPNSRQALTKALNEATEADIVCVTGSLYLVGELRPLLR